MVKKNKKDSLSIKILQYLGDASKNLLDLSIDIMFDPEKLVRGMSLYRDASFYYPQEISNLKKSNYFKKKDKKFYLTERGRMKIIKNILKDKNKDAAWDGIWRGIIFDIPEANRRERNFLRRELKFIGCVELQKSVWIIPFDIEGELLCLLKLWKKDFRGDIRFIRISSITGEKELKQIFNLG